MDTPTTIFLNGDTVTEQLSLGQSIKSIFIDFTACSNLQTDRLMKLIQQQCTGTLEVLSIDSWNGMNLSNYAPLFRRIRKLYFNFCEGTIESDGNLSTNDVLLSLRQLEAFGMRCCRNVIREDDLPLLADNNQQMRRIDIIHTDN